MQHQPSGKRRERRESAKTARRDSTKFHHAQIFMLLIFQRCSCFRAFASFAPSFTRLELPLLFPYPFPQAFPLPLPLHQLFTYPHFTVCQSESTGTPVGRATGTAIVPGRAAVIGASTRSSGGPSVTSHTPSAVSMINWSTTARRSPVRAYVAN